MARPPHLVAAPGVSRGQRFLSNARVVHAQPLVDQRLFWFSMCASTRSTGIGLASYAIHTIWGQGRRRTTAVAEPRGRHIVIGRPGGVEEAFPIRAVPVQMPSFVDVTLYA